MDQKIHLSPHRVFRAFYQFMAIRMDMVMACEGNLRPT